MSEVENDRKVVESPHEDSTKISERSQDVIESNDDVIMPEAEEVSELNGDVIMSETGDAVSNTVDDVQTVEEIVTTEEETPAEVETQSKSEADLTDSEESKSENTPNKPSRELKLLLELSKEANLDTNIPYKRKTPSINENSDHKYASPQAHDPKRSMRSQNPDFVVKHQKFLSKLTSDAEGAPLDGDVKTPKEKTPKKIKDYTSGSGAIDEKTRKLTRPVMALIQNNKDGFCWRCHRDGINLSCETCPRSYHLKCLKHSVANSANWVCPECVAILNAENTKTRSPALKDMSLEQLCGLLKFALKRMAQCNDSDPFLRPVNELEFPDYKKYIVQPMDLSRMTRNIRDNLYGSTNAFEADAKWLLHNSIIFNSYQSKLTTIAKTLLKVCKQEMSEIENCPTCYLNANTKTDWFVEVCPKPHILLWAKLKGFPYWPAKAMSTNPQGMVDVRFFGAHDRAWVPFKECYLYSLKDPNAHKQMKNDIIECIKELNKHIDNLKKVYGEFNYAPFRTPFDPENEIQQLQLLLPTFKPAFHTSAPRKFLKIDSLLKKKTEKPLKTDTAVDHQEKREENKEMEGYGTDEEMETDEGDNSDVTVGKVKGPHAFSPGRVRPGSINSSNSDTSRASSEKMSDNCDLSLTGDETKTPTEENNQSSKEEERIVAPKLKISDKLIKRLSGTNSEMDVEEIEEGIEKVIESVEKNRVEEEVQPSPKDINEVILGCTQESDSLKEFAAKTDPVKTYSRKSEVAKGASNDTDAFTTTENSEKQPESIPAQEKMDETPPSDDLLEEMYSEAVDVDSPMLQKTKKINRSISIPNKVPPSKRKRPNETENPPQKYIKLVDINAIKSTQSSTPSNEDSSILKNRLASSSTVKIMQTGKKINPLLLDTVEIKSEPNSDVEPDNIEDIEAKKQYLSALNISEKVNTVSKPKESRVKTRTNVATKIKEMKSAMEARSIEKINPLPRLIKQLPPNQRARKTFPRSSNSSPQPVVKHTEGKVSKTVNTPANKSLTSESQPGSSNVVLFTQPQASVNNLAMLPPNQTIAYTANMGNQILTMVQPNAFGSFIVPTTSLNPVPPLNPISEKTAAQQNDPINISNLIASANAIFTSSNSATTGTITFNTSTAVTPTATVSTVNSNMANNLNTITILNGQTTIPLIGGKPAPSDTAEDYSYMAGYIPDHISKSISELMHRGPPKLKPRPPGPLSNSFDPGMPSSAGRVTSYVNSVAHKLSDYFRSLLVETLNELGAGDNPDAIITSLRFENERLKQKHADDILEIKKNVNAILRDIQKSITDERERVIEETKAACEAEAIRRVEEAKSKQWCTNCMKEAQFYCCWNTSYCDYPCQLKHWPKHMSKCTQNQGENANAVKPLMLRKTAPPMKAVPTKHLMPKSTSGKEMSPVPSNSTPPSSVANSNRPSPNRATLTPLKVKVTQITKSHQESNLNRSKLTTVSVLKK